MDVRGRKRVEGRANLNLAQTSDRINKLGPGKCEYIVADLKDKAGCQALCAEVAKRSMFEILRRIDGADEE